jgi:hypothetical protein
MLHCVTGALPWLIGRNGPSPLNLLSITLNRHPVAKPLRGQWRLQIR